jgi:hypothetical protein
MGEQIETTTENANFPRSSPPLAVEIFELEWTRAGACTGGPDSYFSREGPLGRGAEWALFPERGGPGWDLAWQSTEDDGYDLMETYSTVAVAKMMATHHARRNARG